MTYIGPAGFRALSEVIDNLKTASVKVRPATFVSDVDSRF